MITGPRDIVKRARTLRSEMTLPEGVLWRELRKRPKGLKFRRQHPAGIYVLDFYCAAARLAVEVDGAVHDGQRFLLDHAIGAPPFDYLAEHAEHADVFGRAMAAGSTFFELVPDVFDFSSAFVISESITVQVPSTCSSLRTW